MGKLLDLVLHPDEFAAAINLKFFRKPAYPRDPSSESPDLRRCYELLDIASRSFATVILELHPELRDVIMIFYIVLRGLDTIEDDMTVPNETKLPLLRNFKEILQKDDWTFTENSPNEKDRVVLVEFDKVLRELHKLKPEYRAVIEEIADKMGNGMAHYIQLENQTNYDGVKTIQDYTEYCHYVAGLVGDGLTQMALISGFGTEVLKEKPQLFESMGQFLQRTNIIRDYREDQDEGRSFWPKEVWGKYAKELKDFTKPENEQNGIYCISELLILSLELVIECLEYLQNVTEPTLFSFCAIPQVMSIATLELVFNNPDVFYKNVKIRRGTTAKLILQSGNMEGVYAIFQDYTRRIHLKNRPEDPNFMRIEVLCGKIEQYICKHTMESPTVLAAKKETAELERKLMLVGVGGLLFTFGLMAGVAWLAGARFDIIWDHFLDFAHQFQHGAGVHHPNYYKHTPLVSSVSSSASSVISSVTQAVREDL
ncbi:squalene synthase Erg9p [Trichomonascus vanleenenianus]|uniref:bifunctional farnesyl-diphosphate farnesyltransferase/squalene synthase n=1 Tax=Trichomonascus vanleenenianus TaxID=2268995 RepID=UPI003ECAAD6B